MYRTLDSQQTILTLERLRRRIEERIPGAGLARVADELLAVARECRERAAWIARPLWGIRVGVGVLIALGLALLAFSIASVSIRVEKLGLPDWLTLLEAGINDLVFLGLGLFFLVTIETRIKRSRALAAVHELRSIAHVIDMHQLAKDPASLQAGWRSTPSSPERTMTAFELARYLDYCSELLSLVGKVAAVYAQQSRDGVVLNSVMDVESLSTSLSRKIWQKRMLLEGSVGSGSTDAT